MNRTYYFVGGLAALVLVVLGQSAGTIKESTADMPSPYVVANPEVTSTPVPDAASAAIEDLASWPIAATR